jgi:uncharacterized protein (DUF488 family)
VTQPAKPPVTGIGYHGRTLDELQAIVAQLDAVLVDIRYAPHSWNPVFRKAALAAAFGDRYVYVRALGNRNFNSDAPPDLVDYDAGREVLAALGRPALVMCMCRDAATCHRTEVLRRLAADGFTVAEWDGGEPRQLALWT